MIPLRSRSRRSSSLVKPGGNIPSTGVDLFSRDAGLRSGPGHSNSLVSASMTHDFASSSPMRNLVGNGISIAAARSWGARVVMGRTRTINAPSMLRTISTIAHGRSFEPSSNPAVASRDQRNEYLTTSPTFGSGIFKVSSQQVHCRAHSPRVPQSAFPSDRTLLQSNPRFL